MSIDNFFSGGVTCLQKSNDTISGGFEDLVLFVLDQCGIESKELKVIKSFEGEIFSEFIISTDNFIYSLKITLDDKNESFLNEISFLEENKKTIGLPYINGGPLNFSLKANFLIVDYNNVFELKDFDNNSLMEEADMFFIAISLLNNCKIKKNSEDYLNMFFLNNDYDNGLLCNKCELLDFGIEYSEFCSIMYKTRKEIENSEKLKSIKGNCTCHGFMSSENLIIKDGLFKFKNLNYSFIGNPLFDLAFLSVSLSLKERSKLLLFKKYCDFFNLDFKKVKKDYDNCLYIASHLFLYKNFFDFFVSMFVKNEHFDTVNPIYNIFRSSKYLKKLPLYNRFETLLEDISKKTKGHL